MGLETGTNIGDLVVTNPTATDPISQGDDHLRLLKSTLRESFAGFLGAVLITGVDGGVANAYTLTPATALLAYTSKTLVEFTAIATSTGASTLNISGLGVIPIVTQAGVAITAGDLVAGSTYLCAYDGTSMRLISVTTAYVDAVRAYATALAFSTALPAQAGNSGKFITTNGAVASWSDSFGVAVNEAKGVDIASAATINLTTATGNYNHVTGTTTINAITIPVGALRDVVFDASLTLNHSAALLLPGAANITTSTNDRMTVRGDTAGAIVIQYTRANGAPPAGFPYLKVSDKKASGTSGGASVLNDITQTRTLNTTDVNTITGASLSSNTVTLPAGTYSYFGRAPALLSGSQNHKLFLYNASDATYTGIGSSAGGSTAGDSTVYGQFTITASKNFTLRHWTAQAIANGLGTATTTGQVEVYAELEFFKVA